jgi:hypothetical protein
MVAFLASLVLTSIFMILFIALVEGKWPWRIKW